MSLVPRQGWVQNTSDGLACSTCRVMGGEVLVALDLDVIEDIHLFLGCQRSIWPHLWSTNIRQPQ